MQIISKEFPEIKIIENFYQYDIRGNFIKLFNEEEFIKFGLNTNLKEVYYSTSQKDVIRGMHFQLPPDEHDKIVHVVQGGVVDVVLDLRRSSKNFGKFLEIYLSGNRPRSIYIPKGFAHGFKCLENNTVMLYQVTSGYSEKNDCGVAFDSLEYDWKIEDPIISERDRSFVPLKEFVTPFE